jgi:TetR/AcrR family transcriptional regulator, fatty acid metabolism regulator protein
MTIEKNSATRDKIFAAARELFEEKGFDVTSVREIAAKAGVNVALINYHFGSKENLLLAHMEESVGTTRLRLNDISKSDTTPVEKLTAVIELYVDKVFANCRYYHFVHREIFSPNRPELVEAITKITSRNTDEFRKMLEEGQRQKVFRKDVDLQLVSATLLGTINQTTHLVFKKRYTKPNEDEEAYKNRIKKYLYDVLTLYLVK